MSRPAVSVVVPVRDDADRLRRCLAALAASDFDDFDVTVVDDGSRDDSSAAVARAAGATVLRNGRSVGPAAARNAGARAATGRVVFFVDADCLARPDAVRRVARDLAPGEPHDAVFGSYGPDPEHPALVSRWKNLAHRHVHQVAPPEASTFWSGCGAVRRDVFLRFGGFDETYGRPCIEDIELGMRMRAAGRRILLDRELQVDHLKRWRLGNLVRTDVLDRGLPWTKLLKAAARDGGPRVEMNVGASQKVAALAAAGSVGVLLVGGFWGPWLWAVPPAALAFTLALDAASGRGVSWRWLTPVVAAFYSLGAAAVFWYAPAWAAASLGPAGVAVGLTFGLYRAVARRAGVGFAAASVVPHFVYFFCALAGFALGTVAHLVAPRPPFAPPPPFTPRPPFAPPAPADPPPA